MGSTTTVLVRSGAGGSPLGDILGAFINHLQTEGLSASRIRGHRLGARHFLTWVDLRNIPIEAVDNTVLCSFRRHDCCCPGMEGERRKMLASGLRGFMTGALRLVEFLEDEGFIAHPGELEVNLRHLDGFIAQCVAEGYGPDALCSYRSSCRHILLWLHRSRISIGDANEKTLEHFFHHDCVCPGSFESPRQRVSGSRYDYPFRSFLQHLAEAGELPVRIETQGTEADPAREPFGAWLRRHRGVGDQSIRRHTRLAATLAADLGPEPTSYDAAGIRGVLLRRFTSVSWSQAQTLAISMRMYLRYLAANGACSPSLIDAVPTAPAWQLVSLPRYASADAVEHVIACCDATTHAGLRDKAILLLLARLALRAGDIVALRLEDIDWRNALVRVCGKSRREAGLPLPQDAGDAVLAYIEEARPRVAEDRVFLRARAPHRPFASSNSITSIVISALKRAGLEDVRPQGAYLFRHSAATHLLRSGASLEIISALLRHQSMDTSVIYAKTDRPMLLEVAQPWIGDRP